MKRIKCSEYHPIAGHSVKRAMRNCLRIVVALTLFLTSAALPTSCGKAGGRSASDWKGTWYREGDSPFSRCNCEISNVSSEGFDFTLVVYNGNKAGEMVNCHALFQKKVNEYIAQETDFDDDNAAFFKENVPEDSGYAAYYYAEDPRSYVEFAFDESEKDKLDISFVTTGDYTEWTAFEGFQENAQITGIFSHKEEYINDNLYDMGVLGAEDWPLLLLPDSQSRPQRHHRKQFALRVRRIGTYARRHRRHHTLRLHGQPGVRRVCHRIRRRKRQRCRFF